MNPSIEKIRKNLEKYRLLREQIYLQDEWIHRRSLVEYIDMLIETCENLCNLAETQEKIIEDKKKENSELWKILAPHEVI